MIGEKSLSNTVTATMLETYGAWLEGTTESDVMAITRAMVGPAATGQQRAKLPILASRGTCGIVVAVGFKATGVHSEYLKCSPFFLEIFMHVTVSALHAAEAIRLQSTSADCQRQPYRRRG